MAFEHLAQGTTFSKAMAEVLALGGDTDTNACIVGAALGARDGLEALPAHWVQAVMASQPATARPPALHPSTIPALLEALSPRSRHLKLPTAEE